MNYTLIAYTESTISYDRWGDEKGTPGAFETFFTKDPTELIETWANWSFYNGYDSLDLLLNGAPDSVLSDDDQLIWDELEKARSARWNALNDEKQKRSAELLRQGEIQKHAQRLSDLRYLSRSKTKAWRAMRRQLLRH